MKKLKLSLIITFFLFRIGPLNAQERIQKTYSDVQNIQLTIAAGNGIIKRGTTNEVLVTIEYTYNEDDYQPELEQRGGQLRLKEEFRRHRNISGYSEWTLEIPDGMELKVETGSGNIEIQNLTVDAKASSGSGNVMLKEINGTLDISAGSGNISIEGINGSVAASTGSGSIKGNSIKGSLDLGTGSGNIKLQDIEGPIKSGTGSGNIDVHDAYLKGNSSLGTGSGNAKIVLAAKLDHDLTISTGSGNATLDFNNHEIAGEFIMKSNDKDNIKAPFSFDREGKEDSKYGRKYATKEARIGDKNILVQILTGSGQARVRN
jgi:DUF4097 and DUF4098 domain-containing protein YvlB